MCTYITVHNNNGLFVDNEDGSKNHDGIGTSSGNEAVISAPQGPYALTIHVFIIDLLNLSDQFKVKQYVTVMYEG